MKQKTLTSWVFSATSPKGTFKANPMLPYLLLADDDPEVRDSFVEEFEKHVAYATIKTVDDGQALLTFLANRSWKDLPSMILISYHLPDHVAPDIIRELLLNSRYLGIPKLVWSQTGQTKEMDECRMLGVKHYFKKPSGVFESQAVIRQIDRLLRGELSL
jgi:CheY-like chemotaxis protein